MKKRTYWKRYNHCPVLPASPPANILLEAKTYNLPVVQVPERSPILHHPLCCSFTSPFSPAHAIILCSLASAKLVAGHVTLSTPAPAPQFGVDRKRILNPSWSIIFLLIILTWGHFWGRSCHFEQTFGSWWLVSKGNALLCLLQKEKENRTQRGSQQSLHHPQERWRENPAWFLMMSQAPIRLLSSCPWSPQDAQILYDKTPSSGNLRRFLGCLLSFNNKMLFH